MAQVASGSLTSAELWFDATASLGAFRGVTQAARGNLNGAPLLSQVTGHVEADADGLTTGNGLRDRDMMKSLDVRSHPTMRFDLDSLRVVTSGTDSVKVELIGRMSIRGVTRMERIPALITIDGANARAVGHFEMNVKDYGVSGLRKMFGLLKMDEVIRVGFDVTFTAIPPIAPVE